VREGLQEPVEVVKDVEIKGEVRQQMGMYKNRVGLEGSRVTQSIIK